MGLKVIRKVNIIIQPHGIHVRIKLEHVICLKHCKCPINNYSNIIGDSNNRKRQLEDILLGWNSVK